MIFYISSRSCRDRRRQCIILSVRWVCMAPINSIALRSRREFQSDRRSFANAWIKSADRESYEPAFPISLIFSFVRRELSFSVQIRAQSGRKNPHLSYSRYFFDIRLFSFYCISCPKEMVPQSIRYKIRMRNFFAG